MLTPNAKRNSNSELPADVVEEILARLPVKSLLRFKCVCKHWYTLIGSHSFVSRHFGHKSNQDRLLVWHYKPDEDRLAFALFFDDICSGYEEPDHLRMPDTVDDLIGPVNGIFCVVGLLRKMALLNPAMRQFKPFVAPRPYVQPHLSSVDNVLGFGFDSLSGDYKLVQIQYFWNHEMNDRHDSSLVSIYNSGTDSWRHFEDVGFLNSSYRAYRSLCNTYLDGVCYWLMKYNYGNVASVLAFDLTTEKFQEIQVPNCIELKKWDLALYRDSIALLSYDLDKIDKCIDIWVMEKEGCWTKSSTVGPFQDIRWPICLWKNDELLLETGTSVLTLCNVFTKKLRTVGTQGNKNDLYVDWVCSYKESLVSINGEGDDCVLWDTSSDIVKEFFNY